MTIREKRADIKSELYEYRYRRYADGMSNPEILRLLWKIENCKVDDYTFDMLAIESEVS